MRGNNNNNYMCKRYICEGLSKMTNISSRTVNGFIGLLVKSLVHKLMTDNIDDCNGKKDTYSMEIPDIGVVNFSLSRSMDDVSYVSFEFEDEMKRMICEALSTCNSPLIKSVDKKLVDTIRNKYKDMI